MANNQTIISDSLRYTNDLRAAERIRLAIRSRLPLRSRQVDISSFYRGLAVLRGFAKGIKA